MQRKIFTADILDKLRRNGEATRAAQHAGRDEPDHIPVVKVFNPYGAATWILTEIAEDGDTLFGLCDLGQQCPELGYVSRAEIEELRIRLGGCQLPLERDEHFETEFPLSAWAEAANAAGQITGNVEALKRAEDKNKVSA